MKTSILVIAHNEEKYIAKCIESLLDQTQKADEIVLIAHNCIDQTENVASKYPIKVVSLNGPGGIPHARIRGFEEVSGDIVACLDGDSVANRKWLANIIAPLLRDENVTIVAGYVILTNNLFSRLASFFQFMIMRKLLRKKAYLFAWGSNFACRKVDYEKIGGFAPILELKKSLRLNFWAEDVYISLALMEKGRMFFALDAITLTEIPDWKINPSTAPLKEWQEDNSTLFNYFKNHRE